MILNNIKNLLSEEAKAYLEDFNADGEEEDQDNNDDYTMGDDEEDTQEDNQDQNDQDDNTDTQATDGPEPEESEEYNMDDDEGQEGEDAPEGQEGQEEDQGEEDEEDNNEDEYTLDNPEGGEDNQEGEEGQEDEGDQGEGGEDGPDQEDSEEHSMDGDEGGDDQGGGEGDDSGDLGSDETTEDDKMDSIKQIEKELFDKMTPEQKKIKIETLKQNYIDLFNRCDTILDTLTEANPEDESTSKIFVFIQNTLSEMKENIHDYLTKTFDTKSYIENDAQFKQYLVIIDSIDKLLENFVKTDGDKQPEQAKTK